MRKLFAIFVLCGTLLFSILLCYAEEPGNFQKDLPLAFKYETKEALLEINAYTTEARSILAEQQVNLDILGGLYYLGYSYKDNLDGASLERSLSWGRKLDITAPIYQSELYKGYYKIRADKLMKQYKNYQSFDYAASDDTARTAFDSYLKTAVKNEAAWRSLVIQLQEKLMDQLPELDSAKRKSVLAEIYALRKPENKALCLDYIYQLFESRAKTEFMAELIEKNKTELRELCGRINIQITAARSGSLQIKYTSAQGEKASVEILNSQEAEGRYSGTILLGELLGMKDGALHFQDAAGQEQSVDMQSALKAIALDDKGFLQLGLNGLLDQNAAVSNAAESAAKKQEQNEKLSAEQLRNLEALYAGKAAEAQSITKELNRLGIYLELKNKNINNQLTKKFEADKKQWRAALEAKLTKFGPGGAADYAAFIKRHVLFSRTELAHSNQGRTLIARFRNSIVQYKQPDDSSLWITDILYNFSNMK